MHLPFSPVASQDILITAILKHKGISAEQVSQKITVQSSGKQLQWTLGPQMLLVTQA